MHVSKTTQQNLLFSALGVRCKTAEALATMQGARAISSFTACTLAVLLALAVVHTEVCMACDTSGGEGSDQPSCTSLDYSGLRDSFLSSKQQHIDNKAGEKQRLDVARASCDDDGQNCRAGADRNMIAFSRCVQAHKDCVAAAESRSADSNAQAEENLSFLYQHLLDIAEKYCASHTYCGGESGQCKSTGLFGTCVCP